MLRQTGYPNVVQEYVIGFIQKIRKKGLCDR